jgi:hypothetical protein
MRAGLPRAIITIMRILPLLLLLSAAPAHGGGLEDLFTEGKAGLDLRLRYEGVEQSDKADSANADTLRLRLDLESGVVRGFSGLVQLDHVEAIGDARYDDTRNGQLEYPVVPDPQGTDLNQAWLQYRGAADTVLRAGRQRIAIGNERFVGPVGWRQNEQSFDAIRVDTAALPATRLTYAYVDRVLRVFGPEDGAPPAELSSDSHLFDARISALPVGTLALYGYHLDFGNAPQLSADTVGARYDGELELARSLKAGWALEYAAQRDAGANAADVDAHYQLVELRLQMAAVGVTIGRETLSGERGSYDAATNPAFQTPLATLHPFQGWADKFTTTPSAGVVDAYVGASAGFRGWKAQAAWHEFGAEATDATYGTELDLALSRKFAGRYELLAKYADYSADGLFTSTRKFWLQLSAAF